MIDEAFAIGSRNKVSGIAEVERAESQMESIINEIHQTISHIERDLDVVLGQETPRPSQVGSGNSIIHARLNEILDRLQGLQNRISL